MTCYDCIHCERCSDIDGGFSCHCSDVSKCKHFKNKADFAEVKHGYWDDCKCSVCGKLNPTLYLDEWDLEFRAKDTPYCPNCGAKMDEKRKEK